MKALTKADWQSALDVQDACNLSGVVHSLARILPRIREEVQSTGLVNEHPIVVLYVDKLASLARTQGDACYEAFRKAYDAVEKALEDQD
jgi:hypothetical protein